MQKLALVIRMNRFADVRRMIGPARLRRVQHQFFNVVRSACRSSDIVLRCRADECDAVVWVSDPDDGALLADRIQDRVRSRVFDAGDGIELGLTCSIGFSAHPLPEGDADTETWMQTVELARDAVQAAMKWSHDSWVGYLGNDRPPPAIWNDEWAALPPAGRTRVEAVSARTRLATRRRRTTDRREEGGASRPKTLR